MEENRNDSTNYESLEDLSDAVNSGEYNSGFNDDNGGSDDSSSNGNDNNTEAGTANSSSDDSESGVVNSAESDNNGNNTNDTEHTHPSAVQNYEQVMEVASVQDRNEQLARENAMLRESLASERQKSASNANSLQQDVAAQLSDNTIPEFDMDAFAYASDEERARMLSDRDAALISSAEERIMQRLAPVVKKYDEEFERNTFDNTMKNISGLDRFDDVDDMKDDIRRISAMDDFKHLSTTKRVALAALIAKGLQATRPVPPVPPPDINKQANEIFSNQELMKAIEARKANALQTSFAQSIPGHSAMGNLSSAAYHTPDKPASIEELGNKYGAF